MASLKRAKSARQVEAICATMIEKFGGINRLCKVWKDLLDEDLKRGGLGRYATYGSGRSLASTL